MCIRDRYDLLAATLNNLDETYELVKSSEEVEFLEILESDYLKFQEDLDKFEKMMLLSGEHDNLNAIVEIHPGAGGTESQDWAEMLFRMYQRYASRKDWKVEVLDYLDGDVAGIKSVTMLIKGDDVYGCLLYTSRCV